MRKYIKEEILKLLLQSKNDLKSIENSKEIKKVLENCLTIISDVEQILSYEYDENEAIFDRIANYKNSLVNFEYNIDDVVDELQYINNFILQKVEIHYEVIFLPYKAAMWDCFESIWQEFRNDFKYSTRVIPIPYYENQVGSDEKVLKYEIDRYPENVEVMNFEEYPLKEMKPDIIFIHNIYDDENIVTSVHPNYYTEKLKEVTDNLIYVPYYILGGNEILGRFSPYSMRNIDKIIVQSDLIANSLVLENINREKILPLGTPKADKVIKKHNDFLKLGQNVVDGKKIIFLNTSISSILKYNDIVFQKLERIFEIFENRDDCILLWRPHPLIVATLTSMRPNLLIEFQKILQKFEKLENAIYDTSSDISEAVVISDAYIGEESSSVIHLFGVLGKPIFALDHLNIDNNRLSYFAVDAQKIGEQVYFSDISKNALMKLDMNRLEISHISEIPNEFINGKVLYNKIISVGENLVLSPAYANELAIYNTVDKKIKKVKIDLAKMRIGNFAKFRNVRLYKNKLYLSPLGFSTIMVYDFVMNKVDYIEPFAQIMSQLKLSQLLSNVFEISKNNIYFNIKDTGTLFEFNLNNNKLKRYDADKSITFKNAVMDKNDLWLTADKSIIKFDTNKKTYEYYKLGEEISNNCSNVNISHMNFDEILDLDDYIFVSSTVCGVYIRLDKKSKEVAIMNFGLQIKGYTRLVPKMHFFMIKYSSTEILVHSAIDKKFYLLNLLENTHKALDVKIPNNNLAGKDINEYFGPVSSVSPFVCSESNYTDIGNFIDNVVREELTVKDKQIEEYSKVVKNINGDAGKIIKEELESMYFSQQY